MTAALPVVLIAAVGRNGVIGSGDRLPWHLPGDLAHFRRETWKKPVIFGRRTMASIGRPLPGRCCIVLSRDPAFRMPGTTTAANLAAALAQGAPEAARTGATEIMVAGGASVYAATLPEADELRLTAVDLAPEGDARFPLIDPAVWHEIESRPATRLPGDDASYDFTRLRRRRPPDV